MLDTATWAERIRAESAREGEQERLEMEAWLASLPILDPLPLAEGQVVVEFLNRTADAAAAIARKESHNERCS